MSITKSRDNRTGIVYVYESESYWDKEKKAPRNRKKLIGKLDEATGEIIPTGRRGRKPKAACKEAAGEGTLEQMDYKKLYESCVENLQQKQQKILELNTEVSELKKELKKQENTLEKIRKLLL